MDKVKKHEEEYIHISKERITSFFGGIALLILSFFSMKLLIYKWKELGLDILFDCVENCSQYSSILQLDIMNNIIITFILIFFTIISLFNLYRKIYWEGLAVMLFTGLIVGLTFGLLMGLLVELILGLIMGLILGLITGLTLGTITKENKE